MFQELRFMFVELIFDSVNLESRFRQCFCHAFYVLSMLHFEIRCYDDVVEVCCCKFIWSEYVVDDALEGITKNSNMPNVVMIAVL